MERNTVSLRFLRVNAMGSVIHTIEEQDLYLPVRRPDTHKTDYGKVLLVGGCVGYAGAVKMASAACLRAGAGLVYATVPDAIYVPVASAMTEAMVLPFPSDPEKGCFATESLEGIRKKAETCDVLILGPGLGRSDSCQALTEDLLKTFPGKIILDADGLYAFSRMNLSAEDFASKEIVVTPHHGEFMRIAHSDGITDPVRNASDFAVGSGMITVLKGPDTVIAFPDGRTALSRKGNPGMATGGSGDVLAGLIGGFAAQFSLEQAVINGVFIHGTAGDLAAEELGEYSMLPTDIITKVPLVIKQIINYKREGKNNE